MDNTSKVQIGLNKGKEKIELIKDKARLNKLINDAQGSKAKLLLQMGIITYQKLREGTIVDSDFDEICNKILELDKSMYESFIKIEEIDPIKYNIVCECGSELVEDDKFCSECGKKVEIKNFDEEVIICMSCENEIEVDSKYCTCCGSKVKPIESIKLEK